MKWLLACVAIAMLMSNVELRRIARRRKPSTADVLASNFPSNYLCVPPNLLFDLTQGDTAVNLGTEILPYELIGPPNITFIPEEEEDCYYALFIGAAYVTRLNETSEENSEENSGSEEECEKYPVEEEECEEESGETPEEGSQEEVEYGYKTETLAIYYDIGREFDLESACVGLPYRPPTLTPGAGPKLIIYVAYALRGIVIDAEQAGNISRTEYAPCDFRNDFGLNNPYAANFAVVQDIADLTEESDQPYS